MNKLDQDTRDLQKFSDNAAQGVLEGVENIVDVLNDTDQETIQELRNCLHAAIQRIRRLPMDGDSKLIKKWKSQI